MTIIEEIAQAIQRMDAGEFQSLCDAFLYKIGYESIVRLGSNTGTNKTTKGTPDTWNRCADGKYVFAEYTTQKQAWSRKSRMI